MRMSDVSEFTQYGYQKNQVYTLYGVNVLDYLELYRKIHLSNKRVTNLTT